METLKNSSEVALNPDSQTGVSTPTLAVPGARHIRRATGLPVYRGALSSYLGLCLLDASRTPLPPAVTAKHVSGQSQTSPLKDTVTPPSPAPACLPSPA